jgi:hypothetical protein
MKVTLNVRSRILALACSSFQKVLIIGVLLNLVDVEAKVEVDHADITP